MKTMSIRYRLTALTNRCVQTLLLALLCCGHAAAAQIMVQRVDDLQIDYHAASHRFVLGALQRLWLMPGAGGTANPLTPLGLSLSTPQFSPDGSMIVAAGGWRQDQQHLWLIDTASGAATQLTDGAWRDATPVWHPDGQRIIFASDRGGSDDIWMLSIGERTTSLLARTRGDAYQPAVSRDGATVVYATRDARRFTLQEIAIGRQRTAQTLLHSDTALLMPQYRKDGFSITYLRQHRGQYQLSLLLPIREMLSKTLHGGRALSPGRIAWQNREHYFYVERGQIHRRQLAGRISSTVPMTLWLETPERRNGPVVLGNENTPLEHPPWVLRAARILAPAGDHYLRDHDVLISNGRIEKVARRQPWPDLTIIDLGDATVIPGLIDADVGTQQRTGTALAAGVTLQVQHSPGHTLDLRQWADNRERMRALQARDATTLAISDRLLPDVLHGVDWISLHGIGASIGEAMSPMQATLIGRSDIRIPSAYASYFDLPAAVNTALRGSRLHNGIRTQATQAQSLAPALAPLAPWLLPVSGNSPVQQPLSLHAELLTFAHAGVPADMILSAATRNAAAAIGRDDLGVIDAGKTADLAVVIGDPLQNTADLLRTIAVVRRGEFVSVARLLETAPASVE
ncbi:MAG: amidohydrolase family protein [Pseudomonadota bacterium]